MRIKSWLVRVWCRLTGHSFPDVDYEPGKTLIHRCRRCGYAEWASPTGWLPYPEHLWKCK